MDQILEGAELIEYLGSKGFITGVELPKPPGDEKGLRNNIGENNCFLNAVIQCLWHLDSFRSKFQMKGEHSHKEHCVFCSLQTIFIQYDYSTEIILPPDALRQTMAVLYQKDAKFQLNEMDDAGEVYEALMRMLHSNLASQQAPVDPKWAKLKNKECTDRECVPHSVFAIRTRDKIVCNKCKYVERQPDDCVFSAYCYPTLLKSLKEEHPDYSFADMLRSGAQDFRSCRNPEESCGGDCGEVVHDLLMPPTVFTINVAWDNAQADVDSIRTFMDIIEKDLDVGAIFSNSPKSLGKYSLRGFIAYYGKHYIAFCKQKQNGSIWYYFDDAMVKTVGQAYADVREKCMKGRFQPSVLFYEGNTESPQFLVESFFAKSEIKVIPALNTPSTVNATVADEKVPSDQKQEKTESPKPEENIAPVNPAANEKDVKTMDVRLYEQSQVAVSTMASGSTSFYVVNSKPEDAPYEDFMAERTNWIYKRQLRKYRLANEKFFRMDPYTQQVKDTFEYRDVMQIIVTDNKNLILKFYSNKEAQYLMMDNVIPFVNCLKKRSGRTDIQIIDNRKPEQLAEQLMPSTGDLSDSQITS